jgi:hypothetical protein
MRFDLSDKDCALRNAAGERRHRSLHSHYGCLKRRPRGLLIMPLGFMLSFSWVAVHRPL